VQFLFRIFKRIHYRNISFRFFLLFLGLLSINCPKQPELSELLNQRIKQNYSETVELDIFFATLRSPKPLSSKACSNANFSNLLGSELRFGKCKVNTPSEHSVGSLDSANTGYRNKFFSMREYSNLDSATFSKNLGLSSEDDIIVFVHGFNVGFEEAIYRAAQIKYDMKYQGDILVYTWPAGAEDESFLSQLFMKGIYETNLQNAINSRAHFRSILDSLEKSGKKIHLIAHSMGHQVVLPVLSSKFKADQKPFLSELILNAPDFDINEYRGIHSDVVNSATRVTLYCSPGDNALVASQKVNGNARVGMCARFEGMDVINVNEVDDPVLGVGGLGHGYYSSRPILTDIYQVLLGIKVEKRLFIRRSGLGNSEQFVLRK
jgi:esterase/lipase superfamily enzyme